jgi:hypothetical protein
VVELDACQLELGHHAGRELDAGIAQFRIADRRATGTAKRRQQPRLLLLELEVLG